MRTFVFIFVCVMMMWGFFSCLTPSVSSTNVTSTDTNTTIVADAEAKNGLDLQALSGLVQEVANAEELERRLNEPDGINNLDLNEDDKVDYISVTEYGNRDAWGFSLWTQPAENETQELATIEITREEEQARIDVRGNSNVYGPGYHYSSMNTLTNILIMSYLMDSMWRPYRSSWYYGYYPSYYRSYKPRSYRGYKSYTSSRYSRYTSTRPTTPRPSTLRSPNAGKSASTGIKKSLASPTTAQRSFASRNPSKFVKSGGFGRGTSTRSSSTSSSRNARSSSSSRSFGGRGK